LRVVDIKIEPSVSRCCCRVFYFFKSRGKKEDLVSQPTGTGFSYTSDDRDTCHDETGVSNDLQDFLQEKGVQPLHLLTK